MKISNSDIMNEIIYTIRIRETEGKKVYVDPLEQEGIYLYPSEIKKEKLEDEGQISRDRLEELRLTLALPRAKKRALSILLRQDQTEKQVSDKLKKSLIDSKTLAETMDFLRNQGYVDDSGYASDYLSSRKGRKSYRQIRMDLVRKGISREVLDQLFEEIGDQKEEDLAPAFSRYVRKFPDFDREAARKTYGHFVRKGYRSDLVTSMIRREREGREDDIY